MPGLTLLTCGLTPRLERLLDALPERPLPWQAWTPRPGQTLLFAFGCDALGPGEDFTRLLRTVRADPSFFEGCTAGLVVDGETELDTKDLARRFVFAANAAGCAFPGRPLVEGTGSLRNLRLQQRLLGLPTPEAAYAAQLADLRERLLTDVPPRFDRPRLLVLHASDRATSNTLALGEQVTARLGGDFDVQTLSLRNGTIEDCRGCSYKVCSHFANKGSCFYGGKIAEEVYPAVQQADALLLLLPNYNDAMGANLMAFINRLTSLHVASVLDGKYLFSIVVSGYSGGDLVARQALGALCLNKAFRLPPRFALLETANDPGEALRLPGIEDRTAAFAASLQATLRA